MTDPLIITVTWQGKTREVLIPSTMVCDYLKDGAMIATGQVLEAAWGDVQAVLCRK